MKLETEKPEQLRSLTVCHFPVFMCSLEVSNTQEIKCQGEGYMENLLFYL